MTKFLTHWFSAYVVDKEDDIEAYMKVGIPNHTQRISANIFGAGFTVNNGSETGHIAKNVSDKIFYLICIFEF